MLQCECFISWMGQNNMRCYVSFPFSQGFSNFLYLLGQHIWVPVPAAAPSLLWFCHVWGHTFYIYSQPRQGRHQPKAKYLYYSLDCIFSSNQCLFFIDWLHYCDMTNNSCFFKFSQQDNIVQQSKGSPVFSLISLISSSLNGFHVTNWRIIILL